MTTPHGIDVGHNVRSFTRFTCVESDVTKDPQPRMNKSTTTGRANKAFTARDRGTARKDGYRCHLELPKCGLTV